MKTFLFLTYIIYSISSFGQLSINEKIDSILSEQVDTELSPGLTIGIVKDGKLVCQSSKGLLNLEYNVPFNDSAKFEIASITKQFTSACIAILEKQGKLSVNDDVRKYIPELYFTGDTIKINHLLRHTSGIRNHNVLLDLSGFDYDHQGYTNKIIQELIFRQKGMNNKPGEKILYSNTNYVLLALIIERVSTMTLSQFAEEELFNPLGMSNTFYKSDLNAIIKNIAHPYYHEKNEFKQTNSLTLCVGAGGIVSTISDLTTWSQVFLDTNHRFSYVANFITNLDTLNSGEEMLHARGMFVTPYKGFTTYNHSGRDIGMRSQFICLPDLNLGVIVYTNYEDINAVNVSYKILDLYIKNHPQNEHDQKSYNHTKMELNQFIGHYQELNSDLKMYIFVNNDTLYALSSYGRTPVQIVSESNNCFTRIDNSSVKYTFLSERNSEADLHVDFGGALFYFEKIELATTPNPNVYEYSGIYFSEELNVSYELIVSNQELILNYPNNESLVLKEGEKDVFGANRRTKYTFKRDNNKKVISFYVASEGTVKDILFKKIN